ncbi:MAG: VOC family protein [Terracidiphilus sp.]
MKLNTYVNFRGTCKEALHFYEKHLGGRIVSLFTFDQMPEPRKIPPGLEASNVLHASISIGDTLLLAADIPHAEPMRSAYLTLGVDSNADAERIYAALTEGGEIFMKLEETFFAHRFAQFRDKFGINWMLIHDKPMSQPA